MVAAGYMTQLDLDEYKKRNSVYRDELWTRAGEFLIEKHRPNFLLFHLLTTDSINHKYGPGSLPSFTAYAFTDACLKRLINTLEASGMKDKYTLLITTDHGFKSATKLIRSDAVLRKEELMKRNGAVVLSCDAISKSYGGGSAIYITDPAKKATLVPKLKEIFSKIEGVEKVYDASEYAEIGLAQPTDNEQVGDLFMVAKDGYAFTDAFTEGDIVVDQKLEGTSYAGHHGYFNADPQLNGTFIAYGYGIKKGVKLEDFSNLSVAPTIAKLLGIELPDADGKPLESALDLK
jgi:predicted AlkP superfamily pyrophosphatase or phosphodiesterase